MDPASPSPAPRSEVNMADFSIDLAKLGERDSTFDIGNFGSRTIERVSSNDDGPEDFTLRLGEWMKGTMPAKPPANSSSVALESSRVIEIEALKKELQQAKEEFTESRRLLRHVEEENDLLTQENERQADTISDLQRALEEERLRIPDTVDAQLADLQDEITQMQNQKLTDTISYAEHKAALDKLQDDHAAANEALNGQSKKELDTLRAAIIKAGEGMKKREARILASHEQESSEFKEQISSLQKELKNASTKQSRRLSASHVKEAEDLKQEISNLQEQLKTTTMKTAQLSASHDESSTILELRSALQILDNRLSTTSQSLKQAFAEAEHFRNYSTQAHSTMTAMNAKIKSLKEETKSLKQELQNTKEDHEDSIREKDARDQKMMEDREREWRRRIKVMFKDRETMGNALMMAWGREECGVAREGEKQRYRYKYVDKQGKVFA